jgi:transposase
MTAFLYADGVRIFDYPQFAATLRDTVRENAAKIAQAAGVRRNQGRLPQHLPRVNIRIEPENLEELLRSGAKLRLIGNDITEVMDVIPMLYRVLRYIRPRYAIEQCDEKPVVQAPAPARAVEGGMVSEALLIAVAVNKFAWRLPLNRQVDMMRSQGIEIDCSTLCRWIDKTVWWLEPLYGALEAYILSQSKIFCDETSLDVLAPGKTRKSQLWARAVDDRPWQGPAHPAVAYRYAPDRKGKRADEALEGFSGVMDGGRRSFSLSVTPMRGASFMTSGRRRSRPLPAKPCVGLWKFTPSRSASAG